MLEIPIFSKCHTQYEIDVGDAELIIKTKVYAQLYKNKAIWQYEQFRLQYWRRIGYA
jgi:hypothetical protein